MDLRRGALRLPSLDLQKVKAMRNLLVAELTGFDIFRFDKLEDYTLALSRAHAKYQLAAQPPDELEALFAEAAKHRERLVATAKSLALLGWSIKRKGR